MACPWLIQPPPLETMTAGRPCTFQMLEMEMVGVYCEVHAIAPDGTRKACVSIARTMSKRETGREE